MEESETFKPNKEMGKKRNEKKIVLLRLSSPQKLSTNQKTNQINILSWYLIFIDWSFFIFFTSTPHPEPSLRFPRIESPTSIHIIGLWIDDSLKIEGMLSLIIFFDSAFWGVWAEATFEDEISNYIWSKSFDFSSRLRINIKLIKIHIQPFMKLFELSFPLSHLIDNNKVRKDIKPNHEKARQKIKK